MLKDLTVESFLNVLASDAPAPGGGSASALAAAQGAALGGMVAELSIGRKKYVEHEAHLAATRDTLGTLRAELIRDIDRDTAAFDAVSLAMKLPKDTPEQIAARQEAVQAALLGATEPPMDVLRRCLAAAGQVAGLIGRSNTNAASDLGVAAAMLCAAARGAWLNVLINAGSLRDADAAAALRAEAGETYHAAAEKADEVFRTIEEGLRG